LTESDLESYVRLLVERPAVRALWDVKDRGMPVFAHSIDVALLALDVFPRWLERHPGLDLDAIVIGCIVHDLTKSGLVHHSDRSHTRIMNDEPSLAVNAAVAVIDEVTAAGGVRLGRERLESVSHIVASHHGFWGKVHPRSPEALLVHRCDYYSATHHRMVPIDTNDILPLLVDGDSWPRVGAKLGVGRETVKSRLQESCRAERVRDWPDLVPIWRARGSVSVGSPERQSQLDRVRLIIQLSADAPRTLMAAIRPLLQPIGQPDRAGEPLKASISLWERELG
jgi:hypothetical protein